MYFATAAKRIRAEVAGVILGLTAALQRSVVHAQKPNFVASLQFSLNSSTGNSCLSLHPLSIILSS